MLWENSQDSQNELVANAMRRDRFEAIFMNLHVADNGRATGNSGTSRLVPLMFFMYLGLETLELLLL